MSVGIVTAVIMAALVMRLWVEGYRHHAEADGEPSASDWWKVPEARATIDRPQAVSALRNGFAEDLPWTEEERLRRAFANDTADTVEFILELEKWADKELAERDALPWDPFTEPPRKLDVLPAAAWAQIRRGTTVGWIQAQSAESMPTSGERR